MTEQTMTAAQAIAAGGTVPPGTDPDATVTVGMDGDRVVWVTVPEMLSTEGANRRAIEERAAQALAANRAFIALGTGATAAQNAAEIRALARQMNGVIRLLLQDLDGTD
jgi:predicted dinucleotide-utilizing enzyme